MYLVINPGTEDKMKILIDCGAKCSQRLPKLLQFILRGICVTHYMAIFQVFVKIFHKKAKNLPTGCARGSLMAIGLR